MNRESLLKVLKEEEFHIDSRGRVVIDHADVLNTIHGASGEAGQYDMLWNGACHNSRCG